MAAELKPDVVSIDLHMRDERESLMLRPPSLVLLGCESKRILAMSVWVDGESEGVSKPIMALRKVVRQIPSGVGTYPGPLVQVS